VLETLFSNALKQMPEGSTLELRTAREAEMVELLVRYPAPHFSADDAEHFFYPFTTSAAALAEMDLPMCKIIVNKHGGAIRVELEPPKQLLVRLSLPAQVDRPQKMVAADQ